MNDLLWESLEKLLKTGEEVFGKIVGKIQILSWSNLLIFFMNNL